MPRFGKRSKEQLATCHADLQRVANHAIKHIDFTVTEGHRGKEAQNAAFAKGFSKVRWPNGNHNSKPSRAFDFVPYPFNGNWKDKTLIPRLKKIGAQLKASAADLAIKVSYGGDWKSFKDYPHLELDQ